MKTYFERQIIWEVVVLFVGFIIWMTLAYLFQWGDNPLTLGGYGFVLLSMILPLVFFYKMDIEMDEAAIQVSFGTALFKKKIALAEVYSVSIVKPKWYHGTGIRFQSHGMLYRARFTDAVELKLKGSDRTIQIGSKDVEGLRQAIEARL
jgi:hypothetical protein